MSKHDRAADAVILREQQKMSRIAVSLLPHLKADTQQQLARTFDMSINEDIQMLGTFHHLLGDSAASIRMVAALAEVEIVIGALLSERRQADMTAVLRGDALHIAQTNKTVPPNYLALQIANRCRISPEAGADIWHVIAYQLTHGAIDLLSVTRTHTAKGDVELSL